MTDSIFNALETVVFENFPIGGIGSGTELKPVRTYNVKAGGNGAYHAVAMLWIETGEVVYFDMKDIFRHWTDESKAAVKARLLECTEYTVFGSEYGNRYQTFKSAGELREAGKNSGKAENTRLTITIDKADREALKRCAIERDTTAAEIIRVIVHEWLSKQGK